MNLSTTATTELKKILKTNCGITSDLTDEEVNNLGLFFLVSVAEYLKRKVSKELNTINSK